MSCPLCHSEINEETQRCKQCRLTVPEAVIESTAGGVPKLRITTSRFCPAEFAAPHDLSKPHTLYHMARRRAIWCPTQEIWYHFEWSHVNVSEFAAAVWREVVADWVRSCKPRLKHCEISCGTISYKGIPIAEYKVTSTYGYEPQ